VAWFIENVLPLLAQTHPDIRYWVVGQGPAEGDIRRAVQEAGMQQQVELTGFVSDADRNVLLAQSDVFVMPVIRMEGELEGFGIVCLEAGQRGVPVVAPRMQGMCTAVKEGETGIFYEPDNVADCVRAIEQMIVNPLDAPRIAHVTGAHFSWPLLLELYHERVFSA
jgi:glycosyltransferase involved in cell wall biosynthesis